MKRTIHTIWLVGAIICAVTVLAITVSGIITNDTIKAAHVDAGTAKPASEGVGRAEAHEANDTIIYWITEETPKKRVSVACSDDELEELAILAYLEAGAQSEQCIRYVVEVVFNQLEYGAWGSTLHDVIWSAGNFEPAYMIPYAETTDAIRAIVRDVYENGISIPSRIMFFRANHYHEWNGAIPEFAIENVFFSSSIWCK